MNFDICKKCRKYFCFINKLYGYKSALGCREDLLSHNEIIISEISEEDYKQLSHLSIDVGGYNNERFIFFPEDKNELNEIFKKLHVGKKCPYYAEHMIYEEN